MNYASVVRRSVLSGYVRPRWMAGLVVMALLAAACGDGGSSSGSGAVTTAPLAGVDTTRPTASPSSVTAGPASSTSAVPTTVPASTSTVSTAPVATTASHPATCEWTPAGNNPELTFVSNGQLLTVGSDGVLRCLAEVSAATRSLLWSPTGERVLVDDGVVVDDGRAVATGSAGAASAGWTWPTGKRFVRADGGSLTKVEADGSGVIDISFLDHHGPAVYHPDGLHLAVAGTGTARVEWWIDDELEVEEWTQTGLFLVRNDGSGEQVWIDTFDAEITDVVFSADGTRLSFLADHHDVEHVHSFDLPDMIFDSGEERILAALPEDPEIVEPLYETVAPLSRLTVDPANPDHVMFAEGDCAAGVGVELLDLDAGGYPVPVASGLNAVPVGFLDPDRVAVLELSAACDGSGALWEVRVSTDERILISPHVDAAAVRSEAPELRLSLQDIVIAGFA